MAVSCPNFWNMADAYGGRNGKPSRSASRWFDFPANFRFTLLLISYSRSEIVITDDQDPGRPPLILPAGSTLAEVAAAVAEYSRTAPEPDYIAFYNGMLVSNVYQTVMAEPSTPDQVKAMLAFVSQLQECMSGRENRDAMQSSIWLLLSRVPLSPVLAAELFGLMQQHHLAGVYRLQP